MRLYKRVAQLCLDLNIKPDWYEGNPVSVETPHCLALSEPVSELLKGVYECNCFDGKAIDTFFTRISDLLNTLNTTKASLDLEVLMYCLDKLILVDNVLQHLGLQDGNVPLSGDCLEIQSSLDSGIIADLLLPRPKAPLDSSDEDDIFFGEVTTEENADIESETDSEAELETDGYDSDSSSNDYFKIKSSKTSKSKQVFSVESEESEEEEDEVDEDFDTMGSPSLRISLWICKLLGISSSESLSLVRDSEDLCEDISDEVETRLVDLSPAHQKLVTHLQGKMTQVVRVKPNRDPEDLQRERITSLLAVTCGLQDLIPTAVQLQDTAYGNVLVQPLLDSNSVDSKFVRSRFALGDVDLASFQQLSMMCLFLGAHDAQAKNFFVAEPLVEGGKSRIGMTDRKGSLLGRDSLHTVIQVEDNPVVLPIAYEFLAWDEGCDAPISPEVWDSFSQGVHNFIPILAAIDPESASSLNSLFSEMSAALTRIHNREQGDLTVSKLTYEMYPMMHLAKGLQVFVESTTPISKEALLMDYFDLTQFSVTQISVHLFDRLKTDAMIRLFELPELKALQISSMPQLLSYCLVRAANTEEVYSPNTSLTNSLEAIFKGLHPEQGAGPVRGSKQSKDLLAQLKLLVESELSKIPTNRCAKVLFCSEEHAY